MSLPLFRIRSISHNIILSNLPDKYNRFCEFIPTRSDNLHNLFQSKPLCFVIIYYILYAGIFIV